MDLRPQTFIFAGPAGSGKGTQVDLLKKYLAGRFPGDKIFHFYTGDGFRNFVASEGYSAGLSRAILERGGLQPEFLAVWLWASAFINNLSGSEHLLIDGSPRKRVEAEALDSAMQFYRREKPFVVVIDLPREEAVKRLLLRARHDDNRAAIEERLNWYYTNVVPAVDFYRGNRNYRLLEIDGNQSVQAVHADIIKAIGL